MRQPLSWCSVTRQLRRIYTTNCNISFDAVSVCRVIQEVYLRVPKYRPIHQKSTGWKRAIIVYWINNHHSLIHVPRVKWGFPAVSLGTFVLGQHAVKSYQASCVAPALGSEPCPALPTTAAPSGRSFIGWFLHHEEPVALSHHRLDAAYLGSINNTQVLSMQQHKHIRFFMRLYLLKHLFHLFLGQVSIPVQNNIYKHTFHLKSLGFKHTLVTAFPNDSPSPFKNFSKNKKNYMHVHIYIYSWKLPTPK